MKRIFLITSLIIALTLGGVSVATSSVHTHETIIAGVSIADVVCPCGCGMKAIDCLCGAAVEALKEAGFGIEEIEDYLKSEQL